MGPVNLNRRIFVRNYTAPKSGTPLFVRSCGYYKCVAPFKDRIKKKQFLELFWVIRGNCIFILDGEEFNVSENWTFFYFPGDMHYVQVRSGKAEYVWLTIHGDQLQSLIGFLGVERGSRYSGSCPIDSFTRLENCMSINSEESEIEAGKLAFSILSDALCGTPRGNLLSDTFKMLVQEKISDPQLNIVQISAALGVHRSTLHKVIRQETGLPPLEWITRRRIEYAYELLSDSKLMIKEIADRCGIADQNYFSKLVRRYLGNTPSGLRKRAVETDLKETH